MPLTAPPATGGDFKLVPEGTHRAVCNQIVDLGVQRDSWQGEEKLMHKIFIRWELPDERIDWEKDGEKLEGPMVIGNEYTFSFSDKANLKRDLESWRGKRFTEEEKASFDMFNLLGAACQVTVTHRTSAKGRDYANVTGVAGWPKGMEKPAETECKALKYSQDEPEAFSELPEWLRDKIQSQVLEEQAASVEQPEPPVNGSVKLDDEIPF